MRRKNKFVNQLFHLCCLQFERGTSHFNSTHRVDFKNYGKYLPDVDTRRKALQKHDVSMRAVSKGDKSIKLIAL